jgi:hypothetical protein
MNIPKSPSEMPTNWHNNEREIRNAIVSLDQYDYVDIHWERDIAASEATGDNVGEWDVLIESGKRRVTAKHREITNAIWFAIQVIDAQADADYEIQQAARKAALNKLTLTEKQLLGIVV